MALNTLSDNVQCPVAKHTILQTKYLGLFFILLGIITLFWHIFVLDWRYVFWFCNHAMLIVGWALLKKNRFWLTAMLNWSIIPVSLWVVDFLSKLLFGFYIFGITSYMFAQPFWKNIVSLQHLFTVPLMLYALWLVGKPHPRAWIGTTLHGTTLWLISYFFIRQDYNVNCVHKACVSFLDWPNYAFWWIIVGITMFFATNKILSLVFNAIKARH